VPFKPPIKGIDLPNVVEVCEFHMKPELVRGEQILVAGGGISGCDINIW
jgi:cation diffusion facilitator CzcD-associated flavoprotein CzcO